MEKTENESILEELKGIRGDLDYIKENMLEKDVVLSSEESLELREAVEEYGRGESVSLDEFKKKLGKKP